jgi:hypothetical protein
MESIIDLDRCVIDALNLFSKNKLPKLPVIKFKRPLVVGSGNAAVTGKILFAEKDAVFADESNYKDKLKRVKAIDGCVLISSSGKKHSPLIAKEMKKKKIPVVFITNNPESEACKYAEESIVFPKNSEPYTYNTSTYLGMILSKTKENPKEILRLIEKIKDKLPTSLSEYDSFFFIVPDKFEVIREMYLTKFDELFGSKVMGRAFTLDQTKHAKTLVPSDKELFISLVEKNEVFGTARLNIELPKNTDYGTLMCVGYYIIGQIQKQKPQYYKENIENYAKEVSNIFKQQIGPVAD